MIDMEAEVVEYSPNAMQDDFASGGFASYDATALRIHSPGRLKGRTISVFHRDPMPENSFWRRPGARVRFSMEEADLEPSITLFTGGLWNIREIF